MIHLATMLFSSLKVQMNVQMIPLKQFESSTSKHDDSSKVQNAMWLYF